MRHIKCYRAIALILLIMSKNVSDKSFRQKFQCSRRPSYWTTLFFLSVEALKLRQGQLHFFTWNHVFFSITLLPILRPIFSDLQHKVILVTQSMKKVEKSKHIGIITFKGSTKLALGLPTEDARNDDPRLVSTCQFAYEKTV